MQVNSAQDYLTMRKRQIMASTYGLTPPPRINRFASGFTSVLANQVNQRQRFVAPFQGANGGASGGASYSSTCCGTGVLGAITNTTDRGLVRFNVIRPMSVTLF